MLNTYGEVADFAYPVDQFGKSPDACGPFAVGYVGYMGEPTKGAKGQQPEIAHFAEYLYTKYIGPDIPTDYAGTSIPNLYCMLADATLPFFQRTPTLTSIETGIARFRPMIVSAAETGMWDMNTGRVDYGWTPTGNHIVVISGIRKDGALLVRDPANIAPSGQRGPAPIPYDAKRFGPIVSVTEVLPPWQVPAFLPIPLLSTLTPAQQTALQSLRTNFTQMESIIKQLP